MKCHLESREFKAARAWGGRDIGLVDMHYREDGLEKVQRLSPDDICFAEAGDEHVARPLGEARILVTEKQGGV